MKFTIYKINSKGRVSVSSLFCSLETLWESVSAIAEEGACTTVFCNGKEVLQIG